jgi:hypothetical protein
MPVGVFPPDRHDARQFSTHHLNPYSGTAEADYTTAHPLVGGVVEPDQIAVVNRLRPRPAVSLTLARARRLGSVQIIRTALSNHEAPSSRSDLALMAVGDPLLDAGAQKTPLGAQSEGRNLAALGQPVHGALMAPEKLRDFVQCHHGFGAYF